MSKRFLKLIAIPFLFAATLLSSQEKRDYQWILGYDYSGPDDKIISLDFLEEPMEISQVPTISGFWMEGANSSLSNFEGNLLFYTNGCKIVNANGEVMQNGDNINPGIIQNNYCLGGGSPIRQGVIALPAPESDTLCFVFDLDLDQPYFGHPSYLGVAPQRLFYQIIDMTKG